MGTGCTQPMFVGSLTAPVPRSALEQTGIKVDSMSLDAVARGCVGAYADGQKEDRC
jgi:hypothetical protein